MTKQQMMLCQRESTRATIVALGYFPGEWQIHVEFGSRVAARTVVRRVKGKETHRKTRHLYLRLLPEWLDAVHAKGWAVIGGVFNLICKESLAMVQGMDVCLLVDGVYVNGDSLADDCAVAVLFAGDWSRGDNVDAAVHQALRKYREALLGDGGDPLPF